ncbi:MAG: hypothetical protein HY207_03530 [Nitrospirae bacterium]|nr:hypothetical protein [Nitrospirota bacterium]
MTATATTVIWMLLGGPDAQAIPAFARKYDMDCSHCHSMVPKLNPVGYYFHDNFTFQGIGSLLPKGLQDKVRSEDPEDQHPAYWPVSLRAAGGYQAVKRDHQLTSGNVLETISTNGFGFTTFELMAGGLLAPDVSYYLTYYPAAVNVGFPGQPPLHLHPGVTTEAGQNGALGFAWVAFAHVFGTGGDHGDHPADHQAKSAPTPDEHGEGDAHAESVTPEPSRPAPARTEEHDDHGFTFRVGSHELDMTLSGHHRLSNAPYLAYRYIPEGHNTSFSLDAPQLGAAAEAHVPFFESLEYAISLFNGPNNATDTNQAPDVFVHLARQGKDHRLGLFALRGLTPVSTATVGTPPSAVTSIPGTGKDNQPFLRYGADADLNFGSLNLLLFYMQGHDDAKLFVERAITAPVQAAAFYGGFVEADYLFESIRTILAGRYDLIRNTAQGITTLPAQSNDADAYTLALKHDLVLSSRANLQLHVEANSTRTRAQLVPTTTTRTDQTSNTLYMGVDFSF